MVDMRLMKEAGVNYVKGSDLGWFSQITVLKDN
jgi:hypothetical protein